jgi:glycosyltransferase involved in cell wall biosynthesis
VSDRARICLLTSGHLSSCPRIVKAADALHEAGYRVRVVCASHLPSHEQLDEHLLRERGWQVTMVRFGRDGAWQRRAGTALAQRAAERAVRVVGVSRAPLPLVAQAFGRLHSSLHAAAAAEPADLYYGGTAGALAATAQAARARRVPYALDLEDFHSAEQDDSPQARRAHALIARIERDLFSGAAFLTAGSEAMAEAYLRERGRKPIAIDNVFPLPQSEPALAPSKGPGLRVYWFSQTIGPGRGLEDAVRAAGMSGVPIELHLRGGEVPGYVRSLRALAHQVAPALVIMQHGQEPPDPIELCRRGRYDVGLALEQSHVFNRTVCLTNKTFTYLAAGLAVAFTDTEGQRALAQDLGEGAFLAPLGDVPALAAGLARWASDRALLARARRAAWDGAVRRWRWDHPLEKGALLEAVARALG